jgi:hypothetical protein
VLPRSGSRGRSPREVGLGRGDHRRAALRRRDGGVGRGKTVTLLNGRQVDAADLMYDLLAVTSVSAN